MPGLPGVAGPKSMDQQCPQWIGALRQAALHTSSKLAVLLLTGLMVQETAFLQFLFQSKQG